MASMTWNYRIIRRHGETFSKEDEYYVLTEVHYKDDGSLWVFNGSSWLFGSEDNIVSDSRDGIIEKLERMLVDAKQYPELYEKDFE